MNPTTQVAQYPMPRPTLHVRQDRAPKVSGHETVLRAIMKDGRKTNLVMLDGTDVIGTVVAFDKYTVSIDTGNNVVICFKHGIQLFFADKKI